MVTFLSEASTYSLLLRDNLMVNSNDEYNLRNDILFQRNLLHQIKSTFFFVILFDKTHFIADCSFQR